MPNKKRVGLAVYELLFGLIGLGALLLENVVRALRGTYVFADIWSYFTYQSNLIAAFALLASSYALWRGKNWKWIDPLRGAATLYMIITGLVFALLVHNASPAVAIDNHIMHQLMPVVMVVGWLIHQPTTRISFDRTLKWLFYPWVYAGFALVHGTLTGEYFYNFLDPTGGGFRPVVVTIGALTLFAAFVAFMMIRLPRRSVATAMA